MVVECYRMTGAKSFLRNDPVESLEKLIDETVDSLGNAQKALGRDIKKWFDLVSLERLSATDNPFGLTTLVRQKRFLAIGDEDGLGRFGSKRMYCRSAAINFRKA
jgi:hypothetical protein